MRHLSLVASILAAVVLHGPALAQERAVEVGAISGVIAGGAEWALAWSGKNTADGAIAAPDGALLFAQEQTDTVIRLDPADDAVSVTAWDTHGAGSLAGDAEGRLYAVQRTCTDPGLPDFRNCPEATKIVMLAPQRVVLADSFDDGRDLGRLNDLIAAADGGVYFTVGGAYYAAPHGSVTIVAERPGMYTNGIMLSPDEATLYVTNGAEVLAFDVGAEGATSNERVFARLDEGDSGDGMAVDTEGRLYVTGIGLGTSIYVFSSEGERLGVIPAPRAPVSIAFAGPERRTLYLTAMGATDADGEEHSVPEGARNTAMSVYRIPMLAAGFAGRAK